MVVLRIIYHMKYSIIFKSFYNLEYTDTDICFNIHEDDIENLILQGFKDISNYMKQFEIETITT